MERKRAIYPTTLIGDSMACFGKAVSYCVEENLDLYILYSFRLINPSETDAPVSKNFIKDIQDKAAFIFGKVEEEHLQNVPINYQFIAEVGFLADRVLLNIDYLEIGTIILCPSVLTLFEDSMPNVVGKLSANDRHVHCVR